MEEKKPELQFAFQKKNYLIMLGGLVVIIIGFMLMSGGGSDNPNVFKGDYLLSDKSFDALSSTFEIEPSLLEKLETIRGVVYPGEDELMAAIAETISAEALESNYFNIRSATEIHAEIFSPRRITLAPIVVLIGYCIIMYAILYTPKRKEETDASVTKEKKLAI